MFNSQKINNDPWPWKCREHNPPCDDRKASIACPDYAPSAEFNNNPNRALVAFREYCTESTPAELQRAAARWLEALNDPEVESEAAKILDEIYAVPLRRKIYDATTEHARKVFTRLASV